MLSTRDQLQIQGHIQTESEMIEKVIPCKWKSKESHGSNARIRKKKKKKKNTDFKRNCHKRQRYYIMIKEVITVVNIYAPAQEHFNI